MAAVGHLPMPKVWQRGPIPLGTSNRLSEPEVQFYLSEYLRDPGDGLHLRGNGDARSQHCCSELALLAGSGDLPFLGSLHTGAVAVHVDAALELVLHWQ